MGLSTEKESKTGSVNLATGRHLAHDRLTVGSNVGYWQAFNQLLSSTPRGNDGRIGFYVGETEITPPLQQVARSTYNRITNHLWRMNFLFKLVCAGRLPIQRR